MKKAARMVADDDPQWLRFWAAYPAHVSKKDARAAWAALSPDAALVDQMLTTLDWQKVLWARQDYGTPYPATWLRAERWTDEPPKPVSTKQLPPVTEPWWYASCPHTPKCGGFRECAELTRAEVAS